MSPSDAAAIEQELGVRAENKQHWPNLWDRFNRLPRTSEGAVDLPPAQREQLVREIVSGWTGDLLAMLLEVTRVCAKTSTMRIVIDYGQGQAEFNFSQGRGRWPKHPRS